MKTLKKKNIKILLIEDEPYIVDMYRAKFEMAGYKILVAKNSAEGIRITKKEKPDIILLDIVMDSGREKPTPLDGRFAGFRVLEIIKNAPETKNIPVILLTNLGREQFAEKALEMGAKKYVIKSEVLPEEVIKITEEVLKEKLKKSN